MELEVGKITPYHERVFAGEFNGDTPYELGYFGYAEYYQWHIFGKEQSDVTRFITHLKIIKIAETMHLILIFLVYIGLTLTSIINRDSKFVIIAGVVFVIDFLIAAIIRITENKLKKRIIIIEEGISCNDDDDA